jgi:hypothetical protein
MDWTTIHLSESKTISKTGNALYDGLDLLSRDEARALKLTWCIFVSRAPQEIPVIETQPNIVPTRIASMVVDDAVWRCELVGWMGEATYQDDGSAHRPCQPGQAAGESHKEFGMLEPSRSFHERSITRLVFCSVRNVVPD